MDLCEKCNLFVYNETNEELSAYTVKGESFNQALKETPIVIEFNAPGYEPPADCPTFSEENIQKNSEKIREVLKRAKIHKE